MTYLTVSHYTIFSFIRTSFIRTFRLRFAKIQEHQEECVYPNAHLFLYSEIRNFTVVPVAAKRTLFFFFFLTTNNENRT